MAEIKCPKCGEVIKLDKSEYDALLNDISEAEIEKKVQEQKEQLEKRFQAEYELKLEQKKNSAANEVNDLKHQNELLREQLSSLNKESESKVREALAKSNEELREKENEIKRLKEENQTKLELETSKVKAAQEKNISELEKEIEILKGKLQLQESENKAAIKEEVSKKEQEIQKLQNDLSLQAKSNELEVKSLEEQHALEIKRKEEEIAFYKDLKTRMSTKLVGETLEQHCLNQYNQIRMSAFPNAYFEKDNDASSGSKGDFIFKEKTSEGAELISIMFEMKNENDTTATKHKNEDFLKELDKDRNEKGCEYAVLVSMLEADNEYYNAGIVDVSYRYPKMYVVRPQCFIPIITLLRNASLNAAEYKNQLVIAQNQSLDITNFEKNLADFKDSFSINYQRASNHFKTAIDEIEKTINHLTKVRDGLLGVDNNLRIANEKAQNVTIKKLTKNSPSVAEKFEELKKDEEKED